MAWPQVEKRKKRLRHLSNDSIRLSTGEVAEWSKALPC